MFKKLLFSFCTLALIVHSGYAYQCGTDIVMQRQMQENPDYAREIQELKDYYQQNDQSGTADYRGGVRTVSVVVHVVYNTQAENVSQALIDEMITTMTEDFRRQNADASDTRAQFQSVAADAQIEFCLDQVIRVQTTEDCYDVNTEGDKMKSASTGGSNSVNPNRFLNIWIVDICGGQNSGVAGYAYLPTFGMHGSSIDGLVIDYGIGMGAGNRTATHEIGHYFNLEHTFAGCNSNANGCSDVPRQSQPVYGSFFDCAPTNQSCSSDDMTQNYMNYSNCPNLFTICQANVMNQILSNQRSPLLNSPGCSTTGGAPNADFEANATSGCPGSSFTFTDLSTGGPTSWSWNFQGGTPAASTNANPTITYNSPGTYEVSLTVTNNNGNDTETKSGYITILGGTALPLVEGFQAAAFPPAGWTLDNRDNDVTWERTTGVGGYGTSNASASVDNFNYNGAGQQDWIISPVLDFNGAANPELSFDYAYSRYDGQAGTLWDSLEVVASSDCGQTWTRLWLEQGTDLATAPDHNTQFIPTNTEWETVTVNMTSFSGQSTVQVAFVNRNGYGNSMFLDNINIESTIQNPAPIADFSGTPTAIPVGSTVDFTDLSTNAPTSWAWTFNGSVQGSSIQQNPTGIQYNSIGSFDVSLTATNANGNDTETKSAYITVFDTSTGNPGGGTACDTPTNADLSALVIYGFNQAGQYGFVAGHNHFGDLAKADFYNGAGTYAAGSTVEGAIFFFGAANFSNPASMVACKVWDDNAGTPGAELASTSLPIGLIAQAIDDTLPVLVNFATPAVITGGFYVGIELAYGSGDTVALITDTLGSSSNLGWERYSDNSWHPYEDAYGAGMSHVILPFICEPPPNAAPIADFSTSDTVICEGETVSFTDLSQNNPFNWSWTFPGGTPASSNQQNPDVVYNSSGSYAVTLTVSNLDGSDSKTINGHIEVGAASLVALSSSDVSCFGGTDGSATANVTTGTAPYTHAWSNGGNTQTISNLTAGTYTVTVTDGNDCEVVESINVTQPLNGMTVSVSTTDSRCGQPNGSASLTVNGGSNPYTYAWSTGDNAATVSGLAPGTYTVTITDLNNCTVSESVTISNGQNPILLNTSKNDEFCSAANGSIQAAPIGGASPYIYAWSTGANTSSITGLSAGAYSVTVTDNDGCSATSSIQVDNVQLTITVSSNSTPADCGVANGSIAASASGGSTPYTYDWSTGASGATLSAVAAGSYGLTVTDANGCSTTSSELVSNTGGPTITGTVSDASCFGGTDGSAQVTASGGLAPYNYSWSNGSNADSITNVAAGNYDIVVTDADGCIGTESIVIGQPAEIDVNVSAIGNACSGLNGAAEASVNSGGTAPFSYSWNTGETTQQVNNLGAGTYSVVVTDASGCTGTGSITIGTSAGPSSVISGVTASCSGAPDGGADLTVINGTPPYSFAWSNGATTEDLNNVAPGDYTVTVTDANGCINITTGTIPATVNIVIDIQSELANDSTADGSATANVTGGTAPYTYAWNTGASTPSVSNLAPGTYSVTITDANGCFSVDSAYIGVIGAIAIEDVLAQIVVYPNPSQALFIIDLKNINEAIEYAVYDAQGKMQIYAAPEMKQSESLDLGHLSDGIYWLRINTASGSIIKKLVKTRY